jgi:hypothetical protein
MRRPATICIFVGRRLDVDQGSAWHGGRFEQLAVQRGPSITTAVASGNTLTISPAVSFKAAFKAGLQTYMFVADVPGLTSGWQRLGWWTLGAVPETAPTAVSVTPSSGYETRSSSALSLVQPTEPPTCSGWGCSSIQVCRT